MAPLYFIRFIAYLRFPEPLDFSKNFSAFQDKRSGVTFTTKIVLKQYEHNLRTRHTDVLKIKHNIYCILLAVCVCVLSNDGQDGLSMACVKLTDAPQTMKEQITPFSKDNI